MPLSAIVHVEQRPGPLLISHLGQFPATSISFNVAPGSSLGAAVEAIDTAREADIGLPPSFVISLQGSAAAFRASTTNELFLIIAAVVTMYIVLGVLYESFIHPITILSTLPSAGVGALLALMGFGGELDVVAVIGIILLIGIVKKNAIMMIDFALDAERNDGLAAARRDLSGLSAALSPDPDDDDGGDSRRAAVDARDGRRLRAAPSARRRHRRRPDPQPGADAVHDAGDLSLFRSSRRPASRAARPPDALAGEGAE